MQSGGSAAPLQYSLVVLVVLVLAVLRVAVDVDVKVTDRVLLDVDEMLERDVEEVWVWEVDVLVLVLVLEHASHMTGHSRRVSVATGVMTHISNVAVLHFR